MKIIIDAMGGDNAPLEIVRGALSAHSRFGCDIVLTGDEAAIRAAVARCGAAQLPAGHRDGGYVRRPCHGVPPEEGYLHGRGIDHAA